MFDNLRDSAESSFYEEEPNNTYNEPKPKTAALKRRRSGNFLGMNAQQRFMISLMLMFTVCLVGTLAMFILGKMSLF